jgi:multiple antibiotic resistance protein
VPHHIDLAIVLLLALIGLYSPIAAISSYVPLVQPYPSPEQFRIAVGLVINVLAIALVTLLIGEPVLVALGISTAALSATGGIALLFEAIPLMRGQHGLEHVDQSVESEGGAGSADPDAAQPWRSVVFVPFTFPLTIGGATVGMIIGFRADVSGTADVTALAVAIGVYAFVTGLCVYTAGHAARRLSERARSVLDRVAGILLTAIATILLASGFTRLVVDVLHHSRVL